MPISISMIIVSSQLVVAVADRLPAFDIDRSCKLDVAATAGLSVDQSLKSCVSDEKRARAAVGKPMVQVLRRQQGRVHPAGKHRRYAELRQSDDMPADGAVVPLTVLLQALLSGLCAT